MQTDIVDAAHTMTYTMLRVTWRYSECWVAIRTWLWSCWWLHCTLSLVQLSALRALSCRMTWVALSWLTHYWMSFIFRSLLEAVHTLYDHLCHKLVVKTWAKCFPSILLGPPNPLISKLTVVRAIHPANTSRDWKLPNVSPTKEEEQFICSFVLKRREMPQPVPTRAFQQIAKTGAMCMACADYPTHLLPIPAFLLV